MKLLDEFVAFIAERESIRKKKEAGLPRPWTDDPILGTYRFCNIHREDDKVTKQIREWSQHFRGDEDIWFAFVVARLLNLSDSLYAVQDYLLPWKPEKFTATLAKRKAAGKRNFNPAYIVSTNGISMEKEAYLAQRVLTPLWKDRAKLRPGPADDLLGWHARLMAYQGLGSFIAAQVVADMKYVLPLSRARDWWTFAASGPGSRRGLNRVFGYDVDGSWRTGEWELHLAQLGIAAKPKLAKHGIELHAQDLQNCLCEFDKYRRALEGQGTPKQIYKEEKR